MSAVVTEVCEDCEDCEAAARTLPAADSASARARGPMKRIDFTGTSAEAVAKGEPGSTPGHQAFYPADSRQVVVDDRHHQRKDDHETGQQHLLLHADAEVAARESLERHDEDVAAVEHRNRQQVQQAEVQAERRHERERGDEVGRLARELRDGDRPHQLLRRRLARREADERLQDQVRVLDVLLDAELNGLAEPGLDSHRVVADADAEQPFVAVLRRRRPHADALAAAQDVECDRLLWTLRDRFLQLVGEGDRLAVEAEHGVADEQPRLFGGAARLHAPHVRVDVREHADLPELDAALALDGRRHAPRRLEAAAQQFDLDLAVRALPDREQRVLPRPDVAAGDGDDPIARPDVRFRRRRSRGDAAHDRRLIFVRALLDALIQDDGEENECEQEVHHRSHDEDLEPFPLRLREELVGAPGRSFLGRLAGHLHVAAERQRADAVFGVAAAEADDGRVEPELEFEDADSDALCGQEVPELVHEHQDTEHENELDDRDRKTHQTFNSNPRAMSCACARAAASTLRTVAIVGTSTGACASIARSMTCGIAVKPMRPSRKRATAISFAAFSTTARLRAASSARYARRRHGNAAVSGAWNSSRPARARSSAASGAGQRSGYENAY